MRLYCFDEINVQTLVGEVGLKKKMTRTLEWTFGYKFGYSFKHLSTKVPLVYQNRS